jgi:hypothetical protein
MVAAVAQADARRRERPGETVAPLGLTRVWAALVAAGRRRLDRRLIRLPPFA